MNWALIIGLSWLVIAIVAALVIGRVVRVADDRERPEDDVPVPVDLVDDEPTGVIVEAPPEQPGLPARAPSPPAPQQRAASPLVPGRRRFSPSKARAHSRWSNGVSSDHDYGAA